MVKQHHRLDGHEFEQTLEDSKGQGSLACHSPWSCKESDTTERLNNHNYHHSENSDNNNNLALCKHIRTQTQREHEDFVETKPEAKTNLAKIRKQKEGLSIRLKKKAKKQQKESFSAAGKLP